FQAGAIAAGVSGPARAEKHVVAHGGSSNPALLKWSLPKHPQRPPTSLEPGARRKARGGARWKLKSCPAQVELTEAPAKAAGLGGSHQQPPTPQNTHAHKNCKQEPFFRGISEAIRAHILE